MAIINLRDFYSGYTHNEFVDVPEVVEAELLADRRYHKSHERRMWRNKVYSLDVGDGIETRILRHARSPQEIVEQMERDYHLYKAIKSLPGKQGNRIKAYFLSGMKQREIAESEGITRSAVSASIRSGLRSMPKIYRKIEQEGCYVRSK